MNLLELKPGVSATVIAINRGSGGERRLFDLGIFPGTKIKLIAKHPFQGPVILQVGNSKLAIGRGIASAIEVDPKEK